MASKSVFDIFKNKLSQYHPNTYQDKILYKIGNSTVSNHKETGNRSGDSLRVSVSGFGYVDFGNSAGGSIVFLLYVFGSSRARN